MSDPVGLVGTAITIASAALAFQQSFQARKAAKAAKQTATIVLEETARIKAALVVYRETTDLTRVQEANRRALASMGRYGPGATKTTIAGLGQPQHEQAAADVQTFLDILFANKEHFPWAESFADILEQALTAFAQAESYEDISSSGIVVNRHLRSVASDIKKHLDEKADTVQAVAYPIA